LLCRLCVNESRLSFRGRAAAEESPRVTLPPTKLGRYLAPLATKENEFVNR